MNVEALTNLVRELVDDPYGDTFTPARVLEDLNGAYEDVAVELATQGKSTDIHPTPVSLSVTSAAREYTVTPPNGVRGVRRIVEIVRVDGANNRKLTVRSYGQRNVGSTGLDLAWLALWGEPHGSDVYVYRGAADGLWRIGFYETEPVTQTLQVWIEAVVELLAGNEDEPVQIPLEHRRTIAYRAAILLLSGRRGKQSNMQELRVLYAEGLSRLRRILNQPAEPNQCALRR